MGWDLFVCFFYLNDITSIFAWVERQGINEIHPINTTCNNLDFQMELHRKCILIPGFIIGSSPCEWESAAEATDSNTFGEDNVKTGISNLGSLEWTSGSSDRGRSASRTGGDSFDEEADEMESKGFCSRCLLRACFSMLLFCLVSDLSRELVY